MLARGSFGLGTRTLRNIFVSLGTRRLRGDLAGHDDLAISDRTAGIVDTMRVDDSSPPQRKTEVSGVASLNTVVSSAASFSLAGRIRTAEVIVPVLS